MLVFTNGCFSLLHAGHIATLKYARSLGSRLFVGINSDASIERIKGKNKIILPQAQRIALLQAIRYVDAVFVFEEDTPIKLICRLNPDIVVKGPDYVAADVISAGRRVVIAPENPFSGESTTRIVERLKSA